MSRKPFLMILVVAAVLFGAAAPVFADETGEGKQKGLGKGKNGASGWPVLWKATSPAIHEGDQYTLLATNTDDEGQTVRIRTVIMDHRNHTNTDVVDERVEFEPGEEREFTAVNDYGEANHFNTIIVSETRNLDLAVNIADAEGTETARFNQRAFLIKEGRGGKGVAGDHDHHKGLTALTNTARLAPVSLGVLAVAGLGLYTVRRRTSGINGRLNTAPAPVWKATAAGGLALSAALHIGLVPVHLGNAVVQGIFFAIAGVSAAIIGVAILAWPSRSVYLAGVVYSLVMLALWTMFLVLPPPGAEVAESVDLVGLLCKATELVAATACAVLWFRARRSSGDEL